MANQMVAVDNNISRKFQLQAKVTAQPNDNTLDTSMREGEVLYSLHSTSKAAKAVAISSHRLCETPKTVSKPRNAQENISLASSVLPIS